MLLPLHWRFSRRSLLRSLGFDLGCLIGPKRKVSALSESVGSWFPRLEWQRDQTLGGPLANTPEGLPSRGFSLTGAGTPSWSFPSRRTQMLRSHPGSGKEHFELVSRDCGRSVCVMSPLVLLPAEADPVLEERHGKENPGRLRSSSGSKVVLTLLTKVIVVNMRLPAVYVLGSGLQLLSSCLGDNGSWSGSGSGSAKEIRSKSGDLSLQNSLKNLLQVIFEVLGDTSSSNRGVSNGRFYPWRSSELVRQFVT